jgi:LysR family transcriptional regulator, nitrogen assimilation regulatory protein
MVPLRQIRSFVAVLPFVMMTSGLDGDRFTIRPLDDPPFDSEFVPIEPPRRAMSPPAALFTGILKTEAEHAGIDFQQRIKRGSASMPAPRRRGASIVTN